MVLSTTKWVRKPFFVDAVPVTADNMADVAQWCGGTIEKTMEREGQPQVDFIKVEVRQPANTRQTRAFPGDWVLRSGRQFKVYTDKAFKDAFDPLATQQVPA